MKAQAAQPERPIGIDLFAGAGGLSPGFEQGGFDVLAAVEYDPLTNLMLDIMLPRVSGYEVCREVRARGLWIFRLIKLFREGAEVEFTPKEFALLELFVKRPGRALARDDILNAVCGHSLIVTTGSVDRCVTTLRAKLEPGMIETIRDIGFGSKARGNRRRIAR